MAVVQRVFRLSLFALMGIFLVLPIIAVILYAFATRWTANILPDGYTLEHWSTALSSDRFIQSFFRTIVLALVITFLDIVLVVPASYWQRVRNPRIKIFMELAAAIPFVLPYVVIAFGILKLSGDIVPGLQGTLVILILSQIAVSFPFMYWAVDNAMAAANVAKLNEAAQTSGANPFQTLWQVVLPNIGSGIASGGMLVFAIIFGEFALVQILVGSRFETISIYSLELLGGANANYNALAVVTCIGLVLVFAVSALSVILNNGQASRAPVGNQAGDRKE